MADKETISFCMTLFGTFSASLIKVDTLYALPQGSKAKQDKDSRPARHERFPSMVATQCLMSHAVRKESYFQ